MECEEQTLREMLSSALCGRIGHSILDKVADGEALTIRYDHYGIVKLSDLSDALNHLRDLGWQSCAAVPA